jgi:hypothetical protein
MKKLVVLLSMFAAQNLSAKHTSLVELPMKDKLADKIASAEVAVWAEEKDFTPKQLEQIEQIENMVATLQDVGFDTADKFNLYCDGLFAIMLALGIEKPIRLCIILKNGDQIDIWRMNGFDAAKFFNHINPKYSLGVIPEVDGF